MAITFDTLEYVNELKAADVPDAQAQAQAKAMRRVLDAALAEHAAELATKGDIALVRKDVEGVRNAIKGVHNELSIHRWMLGFVFAGMISLLVKTFF